MDNLRATAALVITQVVYEKKSLAELLPPLLSALPSTLDQALLQELCYGTIRWYYQLIAIAKLLLKHPHKKIKPLVHILILLGLYQLLHLRIPPYAILATTVTATRCLQQAWAAPLVNGLLRNFIRTQEQILPQLTTDLEATYAHPNWLIELVQQSWPTHWQAILTTNNSYPPMYLRVNLRKNRRATYLKKLAAANIAATPIPEIASALLLQKPLRVTQLPGFQSGLVSVQDLAAQYAPTLLELKPGMRVLDACAAPGGKTAHILESATKLKELIALDISAKRLTKITENLERLGLKATLICGDATTPLAWWDGRPFERILVDAPCSGSGIIRRHPDIKLLRQPQDLTHNAMLQYEILMALWPLLAPAGLLVYATCSIIPAENFLVIQKFLHHQREAHAKPIKATWGVVTPQGRQLLPTDNSHDGFFYAVMRE